MHYPGYFIIFFRNVAANNYLYDPGMYILIENVKNRKEKQILTAFLNSPSFFYKVHFYSVLSHLVTPKANCPENASPLEANVTFKCLHTHECK